MNYYSYYNEIYYNLYILNLIKTMLESLFPIMKAIYYFLETEFALNFFIDFLYIIPSIMCIIFFFI